MSLNQLINPVNNIGLNVHLGRTLTISPLPLLVGTDAYTITAYDLSQQRLLISSTAFNAITYTFPALAVLEGILINPGDYMELSVKYRTSGVITVTSVDNLFFIAFGNSYTLQSSNGVAFRTEKIGIARIGPSTWRIY